MDRSEFPNNITSYVASDVEGTITRGRIWEGIRDYLIQEGHEAAYKRFVRRKFPKVLLFRLGLLDVQAFKDEWMKGILALCAGFDLAEMASMGQFVTANILWPQRRQIIVDELAAHQQAGRRLVIATGFFQPLLDEFAPMLGDVIAIGTPLAVQEGRITGRISGPFNVGQAKASRVGQVVAEGELVSAYGDTAADTLMLGMSREPVAVYPDYDLRATAVQRGWRIVDERQEDGR